MDDFFVKEILAGLTSRQALVLPVDEGAMLVAGVLRIWKLGYNFILIKKLKFLFSSLKMIDIELRLNSHT